MRSDIRAALEAANAKCPVGARFVSRNDRTGVILPAAEYLLTARYASGEHVHLMGGSCFAAPSRFDQDLGGPYVAVKFDDSEYPGNQVPDWLQIQAEPSQRTA